MNCLSQEELLQMALDDASVEQLAAHVTECATCRTAVAELQVLDERLARAHRPFSDAHDAGRERLLAALKQPASPHPPDERREMLNLKTGGLSVAQRTAIGGVALAAMLAGVLLWVGSPTPRASAMERMAQNVRAAKSYEVSMDMEVNLPQGRANLSGTSKLFWQAPGSTRSEEKGAPGSSMASLDSTTIRPAHKPGIMIDHTRQEYWRSPELLGKPGPLSMVEGFGRFAGQADRELGTKVIDDKKARGFEIAIQKVDPDSFGGALEVWIDEGTDLPVLVRISPELSPQSVLTLHDFRWNVEIDPKLFDTTPPAGYKDVTPASLALDERIDIFREGLATFAKLSGGHYPRVKIIYGDVTLDEMKRLAKIDTPATPEQIRTDKYVKIQEAVRSFAMLNELHRENADVAYYGQTVEAKDKDKVLLRWQLDDGRYQVMFGDLRSETVSSERLRELEAK